MAEKQARVPRKSTVAGQQARFGATAGLYTIIVLAALVMVNWLANRYNKTYDTTSNKRYTLSNETKKVVDGLKGDATITYFDRTSGFDSAKGMLDRYKNLSPKIHVNYVDFTKNPAEARAYGVRFPGTAYVQIGDRREEAKAVTEEGITGAFLKDLKGTRTVCFVSGSHEHQLDETGDGGLSHLKTMLDRDNYKSQQISLLTQTEVPKDCTVLVVAGPQDDYTPTEVTAIKNYIEGGGRGMFLLDPPLDFPKLHVAQNDGLDKLLGSWGVTPQNDLVLEENPVGQLFGFGPEVPLVTTYESQPIVADLKGAATGFPLSRSLEVKSTGKATVDKLFSTTANAIATTKLSNNAVNPNDPSNLKGPFVLGAAGTYNTGNPKDPGRFVVIGSSGFMDNGTISFQSNRDLAVNAVNWLS
ncbi:MAG: GldG family protein, partial [Bryobacteraceae bacterium]